MPSPTSPGASSGHAPRGAGTPAIVRTVGGPSWSGGEPPEPPADSSARAQDDAPTRVQGSGQRARPMPPAERRAALIAATLPLVSRYGTKVTTRQIAEAAGVAEGTIFRVFPDKEALISSAIATALDPLPLVAEVEGIDMDLPLRDRLTKLVQVLQRRVAAVFNLLIAIGRERLPEADDNVHRARFKASHQLIYQAVSRLLEPDQEQLRYPVSGIAKVLGLLIFSGTHPIITDGEPLTAEQISEILLDGVLHRP